MTRAASYSSMPGAFAPSENAGPKAHLFQPPRTPSASSSLYLARSTTSILSEPFERPTIIGKKRSRHDYSVESNATPLSIMGDWSNGMETSDSMARSESMDPGSPIPFVNTRYQLAGGLDTPTAAATAAHDVGRSEYAEVGYRKTLSDLSEGGVTAQENDHGSYFPEPPTYQFTDANGRARTQSYEPQKAGWSRLAIEVVGGVVGKVWEFCKAGAFRGFAAGGGKAYSIETPRPHTPVESAFQLDEPQEKASMFDCVGDRESTPIPGQYIESPEDDYITDYMDRRALESIPPRPSKRLQISNEDGDLARNWIMVSNGNTPVEAPTSMTKPTARYSMPTASSAGRNFVRTTVARPASRANGRRPVLSTRTSAVSHAGSPGLNPACPASFASPRSPGGTRISSPMNHHPNKKISIQHGHGGTPSPVSIETQKFAARKRREEKEADESIRRFNAQLQAMIREGKEALGTRVEVDETDELVMEDLLDDGFE
jgi:hypothetical protein